MTLQVLQLLHDLVGHVVHIYGDCLFAEVYTLLDLNRQEDILYLLFGILAVLHLALVQLVLYTL